MQIIIDTNVFVSGIFFSGLPYQILNAWQQERIELVLSCEILAEYQKVGERLSAQFGGVDFAPWLQLLVAHAVIVEAPPLSCPVCAHPDDDKFLECALASRTKVIVTGDKALLRTTGYKGTEVLTPRQFIERYLK